MSILRLVAAFASQSARSFPRTPVCPRTNAKSIEMFLSLRLLSCFWISTIILLDEEIHLRESKEERESVQMRENAMANAFWVSVRNNISKRWNTTEIDVSKNQSSADSAVRLPNTSILISNAADITE
ncbi:hypothetical protein TNCV_2860411 [Trichonephila clavipes]|nr:hypothetical protein TNCV_2860411 [Trichonephila clavipes]